MMISVAADDKGAAVLKASDSLVRVSVMAANCARLVFVPEALVLHLCAWEMLLLMPAERGDSHLCPLTILYS